MFFWEKKNHFSYLKNNIPTAQCYFKISRATFLLFCPFLISKVLEVYFDLCLFFSWTKIDFDFQKPLADFFLVKPWLLHQPPEAKLLISVYLLEGQKFSFLCKLSYELQFAGVGWDLTNFYYKETRIVENASLCTVGKTKTCFISCMVYNLGSVT